jgi:DNA-binding transcriptional LysR family regulator
MDLFSLICFVALANYLKFSEAAESLYLSQPAFSKQIQNLESDFGAKLFHRSAWTTELTEAGKAILPLAQSITSQYETAKTELELYRRESQTRLVLSTISFLVHYGLSDALLSFMSAHPDNHLEILESDSSVSLNMLKSDQVDACIIFSSENVAVKYCTHPILQDKLALFVGKQHPLAVRDKVHLSELSDENFQILHETHLYAFILDQCKKAGFQPKLSTYGLWINTTEDLLQYNNSISIIPQKMGAYKINPNIKMIEIEGTDALYLSLVTKMNDSKVLCKALEEHITEYVRKNGLQ